jgi:hypothetical protein
MRLAVIIAATVLGTGAAALADDAPPPAERGKLEVVPMGPPKPPDLSVPRPAATPPARAISPSERFQEHEEPAAQGPAPDGLDRGEGYAALPRETPSGVKALEDWIGPIFP